MKLRHKKLLQRAIIIAVILAVILILTLLKKNVAISEYVFARGISRGYIFIVSNLTSLLPFSLYELFVAVTLLFAAVLFFIWTGLLRKKRRDVFLKSVLNTLIFVSSIVLIYVSTASFSYYRKPLPVPQYQGARLSQARLEDMIRYYFEDFAAVSAQVERDGQGKVAPPYSYDELTVRLIEEYDRLGTLGGYLSPYTPKVKRIAASRVMCYQRISGVAYTPTGEANINKYDPINSSILTMAHEAAHIKGVMIENDANMTAYYLALTSGDIYFRYAVYLYNIDRLLELAYYELDSDKYRELSALFPEAAKSELLAEYDFWRGYDTVFDKVSSFINDLYLKLSGVGDGTDNYLDISNKVVTIDGSGVPQIEIESYSPMQKLFIELYLNKQ